MLKKLFAHLLGTFSKLPDIDKLVNDLWDRMFAYSNLVRAIKGTSLDMNLCEKCLRLSEEIINGIEDI